MKYEYNDGGRCNTDFKNKKSVSDCVVRSIAIATKQPYLVVWNDLFDLGRDLGFIPNHPKCYGVYLEKLGFIKRKTPRINNRKIKLMNWSHNLALVHTTRHLTCVIDNCVYDTGDPREWCVNNYYSKEI
tara:strand:- start:956 stop:1342 length:387 start_codon:yes stop_codon:yes gene_type:complete